MAKGTKLSEFEKGEIKLSELEKGEKFQKP